MSSKKSKAAASASKTSTNVTAKDRVKLYPDALYADGKILFCRFCQVQLDHVRKFSVDQHMATPGHAKAADKYRRDLDEESRRKKQRTVETTFANATERQEAKVQLAEELTLAICSANIPLEKVDHPAIRSFLGRHVANSGLIPDAGSLRRRYVPDIFKQERNALKELLRDRPIAIIVDETSDVMQRYVLQVLLSPLDQLDEKGDIPVYAAKTFFLQQVNHATLAQSVNETLQEFDIRSQNVKIFASDNAEYCLKCFKDILHCLYPSAVHITCLAHVLSLVGEAFRGSLSEVSEFVSLFQSIFSHSGARKRSLLSHLSQTQGQDVKFPSEFMPTRWGTWFDAVEDHSKLMQHYAAWLRSTNFHSTTSSAEKLLKILESQSSYRLICSQAKFAAAKGKQLRDLIRTLQRRSPFATQIWNILEDIMLTFEANLQSDLSANVLAEAAPADNIDADVDEDAEDSIVSSFESAFASAKDKLEKYMGTGQPGIEFLKAVRIFDPKQVPLLSASKFDYAGIPGFENVSEEEFTRYVALATQASLKNANLSLGSFWSSDIAKRCPQISGLASSYLYAVVTSVDAERLHSHYGYILAKNRQNSSKELLCAEVFLYFNGILPRPSIAGNVEAETVDLADL